MFRNGAPPDLGFSHFSAVYGPGNRGNMARLESLLQRALPVPVGRIPNHLSFLFIGNLVSAIQTYLTVSHPLSGRAWIVADGESVSTESLVRAMARAMNVTPRVLRLPNRLLVSTALIGDFFRRLGLPAPFHDGRTPPANIRSRSPVTTTFRSRQLSKKRTSDSGRPRLLHRAWLG